MYHDVPDMFIRFIEGSLEVKLPTMEKSRGGNSQRREGKKREDQRRKKMQVREKVEKWRSTVFPMMCGSRGAVGAEPSGQMRDEKLHAVVARSTFGSQNGKKQFSDHFWTLMSKSAGRCGAKHVWKSKCTKHTRSQTTFGS